MIIMDPEKQKMITCKNHKYDECMYQTLTRMMQDGTVDNCTIPWILNNARICNETNDIKKAFQIHWDHVLIQKGNCDTPCHKVIVDVHGKNSEKIENKTGEIWSYFSFDVAKGEEHLLYTGITVVAEVSNIKFRMFI